LPTTGCDSCCTAASHGRMRPQHGSEDANHVLRRRARLPASTSTCRADRRTVATLRRSLCDRLGSCPQRRVLGRGCRSPPFARRIDLLRHDAVLHDSNGCSGDVLPVQGPAAATNRYQGVEAAPLRATSRRSSIASGKPATMCGPICGAASSAPSPPIARLWVMRVPPLVSRWRL